MAREEAMALGGDPKRDVQAKVGWPNRTQVRLERDPRVVGWGRPMVQLGGRRRTRLFLHAKILTVP